MTLTNGLLAAPPASSAVTDGWVQRYTNPTTQVARGQASKIVVDSSGNAVVTGFILDDQNFFRMLTIKYSGAHGSVLWQTVFESAFESAATALALDGSGNVIVTASADGDYYTTKYAAGNGETLWERRYSGPAGQDFPMAVAVDASGNVIVTGYSDNGITNEVESRVYYTAKYAAGNGAVLWEQRYHSPGHFGEGRSIAVDSGGNVLVTGISVGTNNLDYCTVKYAAADGALLWQRRYDGANRHDQPSAVAVDGSGDVVVTGISDNGNDNESYTAKYAAANGAILWEKRSNGLVNAVDQGLALAGNGDVIVTGASWTGSNGVDYYTAKYAAADGELLWERFAGGEIMDEPAAVGLDAAGNVIVTGYSTHPETNTDYYTVKYAAADGAVLWDRRFSGPVLADVASALAVDYAGNVFVTGGSQEDGGRYYTIKYAEADGTTLWEQPGRVPADFPDLARAMALDGSGNVFVTGRSFSGLGDSDIYTVKYARTTGAILWERRSDGKAGEGSEPAALGVDTHGNVIVTGSAIKEDRQRNFYTVKYAAQNGAVLWEKYYHGLGTNDDNAAIGLVIDSHGNAIVTGVSGTPPNWDYYTAKYAGADGALIWEARFNGPTNGNDSPAALALDGHGNVIVTGSSANQNVTNHFDIYTVKYAAADGTLLWDRRYDGPSKGVDHAAALAIDPVGNVVVAGTSDAEYYTAKYAAANGALLWEKRYSDPTNRFAFAYAVAVDSSGNVIVSGNSFAAGYAQLHTIQYAAGNGAFLWERTTPGQVTVGAPCALLIGSDDNVLVAGSVSQPDGNYQDYYVAKFAAGNGLVLWQKYYDGPGLQTDTLAPRGLAVRDGMIVLAGTSAGDPPEHHEEHAKTDGEMMPGSLARHVVHYEMATVVFWEKVPPVSIAFVPAGVRLRFAGHPDTIYQVQRAPVLAGPWETIADVVVSSEGHTEYLDDAPPSAISFYRIAAH